MTTPNAEPVVAQVTVAAPVDVVWRAVREPVEIRRWFGWDHDGLDDEIEQIFGSGATISGADHVVDMGEGGEITLHPDDDEQTVVRVTRPAPPGADTWDGVHDELNEGWLTFGQQLRFVLERHRGRERRTIRLSGRPATADADPLAVLGLSGTSTFGDDSVWYAAEHQLGLILPDHGDSLLVVTRSAADGSATATVSTYGLDDAEFERLRRQCVERWRVHYTDSTKTK